MLNIELVRFEAQDVITASVMKPHHKPNKPQKPIAPAPTEPTEPAVPCTCTDGNLCAMNGFHYDAAAADYDCKASSHTCGW